MLQNPSAIILLLAVTICKLLTWKIHHFIFKCPLWYISFRKYKTQILYMKTLKICIKGFQKEKINKLYFWVFFFEKKRRMYYVNVFLDMHIYFIFFFEQNLYQNIISFMSSFLRIPSFTIYFYIILKIQQKNILGYCKWILWNIFFSNICYLWKLMCFVCFVLLVCFRENYSQILKIML